jgi:uncharacterized protein
MYENRFYRAWSKSTSMNRFTIIDGESNLLILCSRSSEQDATRALGEVRSQIRSHIESNPIFGSSLDPVEVKADAPWTLSRMAEAAGYWKVGPMAAVAGAVAGFVGERLAEKAGTVIVENGGDIYAQAPGKLTFGLYAGEDSPFADKLAFEIDASKGIGVCTSSGLVGPSLSFGKADAVMAIHEDVATADAAATSIANKITCAAHVEHVVETERQNGSLKGLVACCGNRLGLFGDLRLVRKRR